MYPHETILCQSVCFMTKSQRVIKQNYKTVKTTFLHQKPL